MSRRDPVGAWLVHRDFWQRDLDWRNDQDAAVDALRAEVSPTQGGPASNVGGSGVASTDSLVAAVKWGGGVGQGTTVTYSFPDENSAWRSKYGDGEPTDGFQELSDAQQQAVRDALQLWADLANITFVEVTETSSDVGMLRFGHSDAPSTAWAYYPSNSMPEGGDVWFGPNFHSKAFTPGTYYFASAVHEIGHALGLKHPHDGGGTGVKAPTAEDWLGTSIMSYRSYIGQALNTGYTTGFYPTTPMLNDVAAIQYLYGANTTTRAGDTVYSWSTGQRLFQTIYDAGGRDRIDWSNQSTAAVIDLRDGAWSQLGQPYTYSGGSYATTLAIARGTVIEDAAGGSGSDRLIGNQGANSLAGNGGNDTLEGGGGNDTMTGGAGNDVYVLSGAFGQDRIEDASGSNRLVLGYGQGQVTLSNESGDLRLQVTGSNNWVTVVGYYGGASFTIDYGQGGGSDTGGAKINGTSKADKLNGTASGETIDALAGNDTVTAQGGDDSVLGGTGNDTLDGGDGDDRLQGDDGNDKLYGGTGADSLVGGTGNDSLFGGAGNDGLAGGNGNDSLYGDDGADSLAGDANNDKLYGGAGNDSLDGGSGDDSLYGDADGDRLAGGDGNDALFGGSGSDSLTAEAGNDKLYGGSEADGLDGGAGNDSLFGEAGADSLAGGDGNDTLYGDVGADSLSGGAGRDTLYGGGDADMLAGGGGNDRFVFTSLADSGLGGGASDLILDFSRAEGDKIDLSPLDADSSRGGNQSFGFIGTAEFAKPGQLRFEIVGGETLVEISTDKDADPELVIRLQGSFSLIASDFVL